MACHDNHDHDHEHHHHDHSHRPSVLPAALVAVGLAAAGLFVSNGLVAMKASERVVAVKGLSERDVESNLALWNVGFTVTGGDLAQTQAKLAEQSKRIAEFLNKAGIEENEITLGALKVSDRQANQYQSNPGADDSRYILSTQLKVRSTNIKAVQEAAQRVGELVQEAGIVLGAPDQYGCDLRLIYTDLNKIKPEMIAEATKDARNAAEQFAQDSGVSVGAIRSASQGYFSVSSRDGSDLNSDNSCDAETSAVKKVRVVTNISYFLE
ncbi:MAG: hypothetical protein DI582_04885 [Azospirillum brasilense]|nr:MAG: hypothetical protein DI582_04885 [Azospirillum brasilense]